MKTVRDICKYIGDNITSNPCCIETGCTYVVAEENLIHTTTNNIASFICQSSGGILYSLDIDSEHIGVAKGLVDSLSTVIFFEGDSVASLVTLSMCFKAGRETVDFVCFDSKEFDEDHMVNEYNAISGCLSDKHWVLVDDIHNPNSVKYKKLVPILKELDYDYMEVNTPTGLFVACKGYNLPEGNTDE